MHCRSLAHRRIFYLEDDFFIAEETRENLETAGSDVVLCGSVPRAFEVLNACEVDAALLDLDVAGATSVPVVRHLKEAGVPILLVTAHGPNFLPADLSSCALITKPASSDRVIRALRALLCSRPANDA